MKKMKIISIIVGVVSLCVMFSTIASALTTVTISDDFSGTTPDPAMWTVTGPAVVTGGKLHVQAGSSLQTVLEFATPFTIEFDVNQPSAEAAVGVIGATRKFAWGPYGVSTNENLWMFDVTYYYSLWGYVGGKYPWTGGPGFEVPYGYNDRADIWHHVTIDTDPGLVTLSIVEIGTTDVHTVTYPIDVTEEAYPFMLGALVYQVVAGGIWIDNVAITFTPTPLEMLALRVSALEAKVATLAPLVHTHVAADITDLNLSAINTDLSNLENHVYGTGTPLAGGLDQAVADIEAALAEPGASGISRYGK